MTEAKSVERLLTLGERVLKDSTHIFEGHDLEWEAEELMALTLDTEPEHLAMELELTKRQCERYMSLVARRAAGEPLPLLTGRIEFYGLDLEVAPGAFVPRPSSELTVARALRKLRRRPSPKVVDVCTGAGPIALALAAELARSEVWGADVSSEGLRQARRNAKDLGIDNVSFIVSDMYDSLPSKLKGSVDLITGHVPYVPIDEIEDLPAEVIEHEPLSTLSDETDDGLVLMRRAIEEAPRWLKPGGWLLLEVSDDLTGVLRRMCRRAGLDDKGAHTDEDRLSMVVEARAR
ncbi:MAG: peptide chain release factor N(5)-glutamine methyltransferase [Actinomycetota bacterium]|nr:peptide chain release factor N(5)-glutamine methyltransferase [Actinomycetota bacterium]